MRKKKVVKPVKTVVAFVLDKSGSMQSCSNAAISGFNEYLQKTKKRYEKGMCSFNLTLFDEDVNYMYHDIEVHEVPFMTDKIYQPGGMTALYDASVETIEQVYERVKKREEKTAVLVVIMTDGAENASTKHDEKCLKDLIEKLKEEGWTFVFMGANQDSYATAAKMGVSKGNVLQWNSDVKGTMRAMDALSNSSRNYINHVMFASAGDVKGLSTSDFFSGGENSNVT